MKPELVPVPVSSRQFPELSGVCVEVGSRVPRCLHRELELTLRPGEMGFQDQKPGTDFPEPRNKIMNYETETAPSILARLQNLRRDEQPPSWPKHYAPMPPEVHGWWLKAKLPFHRDCPRCLRAPGAPASIPFAALHS